MSKGNLFLGFGRGKVGDIVLYRQNGEQVARARNRSPKNPQTALQLAQRSILKSSSQAYSMMQAICDHSFEGLAEGTPNQSRFMEVNNALLRNRAIDPLTSGDESAILDSVLCNYAQRGISLPVINEYIVSEGTLPALQVTTEDEGFAFSLVGMNPLTTQTISTLTYADVVNYLGAKQGDQLTALWIFGNDNDEDAAGLITSIEFSRVILDPSDGDMTSTFVSSGAINKPNAKNTGRINVQMSSEKHLVLWPAAGAQGASGDRSMITGIAFILSRFETNRWRRSPASLTLRGNVTNDLDVWYLGDAVRSYKTQATSSLYLNQSANF